MHVLRGLGLAWSANGMAAPATGDNTALLQVLRAEPCMQFKQLSIKVTCDPLIFFLKFLYHPFYVVVHSTRYRT